jgi:hypothetical protein
MAIPRKTGSLQLLFLNKNKISSLITDDLKKNRKHESLDHAAQILRNVIKLYVVNGNFLKHLHHFCILDDQGFSFLVHNTIKLCQEQKKRDF